MKRIYIIIATLFVVFSFNSYSQLLQPYKAKEGISKARTAAEEISVAVPELYVVATIAGSLDNMPIEIEFDESTGESTIWLYMFHDSASDTNFAFVVIKSLIGMTAQEIDLSQFGGQFPFEPQSTLDDKTWIDSDAFITAIQSNTDYMNFKSQNPDLALQMAALANEPMNNDPFWGVVFASKGGNMNCIVNAETSSVTCLDATDVEVVRNNTKLDVYPNPASDMVILTIPNDFIFPSSSLKVYDVQGNLVKYADKLDINSDGQIAINVNNLSIGTYTIIYQDGGQIFTSALVVIR